jgi:hypothetical protein
LALPTLNKEQTDDKIWAEYFTKNQTSGELKKVVAFVNSIPVSNAYPERVFSHMSSVWSKARSRTAVNLVKAELQVRLNITESCAEFAFFLNMDSIGKDLVKAAESVKKIYYWEKI